MSLKKNSILRSVSSYCFGYLLLLCCISTTLKAQDFSLYERQVLQTKDFRLPYRIMKPLGTDTATRFPLVIFLHGAFEKGVDNDMQLDIGGRFFMRDSVRNRYPAYVVFPQCPKADSWAYFENKINETNGQAEDWKFPFDKKPTAVTQTLRQLIDSLVQDYKIDPSRIYIMGLSQGGMGVLDMIARYPETFAAGISICGAGNVNTVKRFSDHVALWLFHGEKDDVVPASFSRNYYKKLQKLHADVRYTEYPQVMHNSWTNAFKEPELLQWLFSKHKN